MTKESKLDLHSLEEEIARLSEENSQLKAELVQYRATGNASQRMINWSVNAWLGSDMKEACAKLAESSQVWTEGKGDAPIHESIEFLSASIVRFTRIGLFRIIVAVLITVATLWFAAAQVMLLNNQNRIITIQKQIEAADRFALFAEREQHALRALGVAFDLHYALKDLTLDVSDQTIPESVLRKAVASATPSGSVVSDIIRTCGIHKYPVGNPAAISQEIMELLDQGDMSMAQWKARDLHRWFKGAADACHKEVEANRILRKSMEAEMQNIAASGSRDG